MFTRNQLLRIKTLVVPEQALPSLSTVVARYHVLTTRGNANNLLFYPKAPSGLEYPLCRRLASLDTFAAFVCEYLSCLIPPVMSVAVVLPPKSSGRWTIAGGGYPPSPALAGPG